MASELRVNTSSNRVGLGTITYTDTGPVISGITTGDNFKTGTTNVHSTGVELANINTGGSTATFGGDLSIPDTIVHTGDTNTKIRFPAADTFSVETGGAERLRIYSSTSGNGGIAKFTTPTSGDMLNLQNSSASGQGLIFGVDTSASPGYTYWKNNTTNSYDAAFIVGGTEKLRIKSDGKVGVGIDAPTAKFEVQNGSNIEVLRLKDTHYNKYLTIRGGGSPNRMVIDSYEGGGGGADIDFASNGSTKLRITSAGKVGVNTTSSLNAGAMTLYSANVGEGTATGQLELKDNAAYGSTPTGGIIFSGHHTTGSQAIFAGIRGFKANTGNGDYDGCLAFDVRKHGAVAYEAMRITEDGMLHISDRNSGNAGDHVFQAGSFGIRMSDTGGYNRWNIERNYGGWQSTPIVHLSAQGRVGINEGSPDKELHITGASSPGWKLEDTTNTCILQGYAQDSNACLGTYSNHDLWFATNSTEKLRIYTSGLIKQSFTSNNSTVAEGLFINNMNNATGNNASLIFSNDSGERKKASISYIDTGNYGTGDLVFSLDNDADSGSLHVTNHERVRITKDGNIGVNCTSPTSISGHKGITLKGTNQNAGFINFLDSADNSDGRIIATDGELHIHADPSDNTGSSEVVFFVDNNREMSIDSSGRVIIPGQPRALVEISSSTQLQNAKITNWASPTFNVGSLWDSSNSRFLAPVAGLYMVGGNFRIGAPGMVRICRFQVKHKNTSNNVVKTYGSGVGGTANHDNSSSGWDHPYVSFTNVIYMNANEYLELHNSETATQNTSYIQTDSSGVSCWWCVLLN